SRENGERLAGMYRAVFEAMALGGGGDASAVFLPSGDREALAGWEPAGEGAVRADVPVPVVFAERAAAVPGAVAVEGAGFSLSFGELEAASNRWASYLGSAGVGRGSVVGVLLGRGV
ncbi:AMP-binding protein, partial [Streptomyces sp. TRM68416]|uniref:AMP-binding protein n=1 Tax=Streptomyces sp. TRM68416 TaxID=2758412 RepID=UPI001661E18B